MTCVVEDETCGGVLMIFFKTTMFTRTLYEGPVCTVESSTTSATPC